jgi:thiamine biosynthesis protein ThiS
MAESIEIQVNGEPREFPHEMNLSDLVAELSLPPERVAIELNRRVVRRGEWPQTILAAGDRIEIVHFVGGGNAEGSKKEAAGRNSSANF